ncbi:MAG TPA: methylenetetrahydrofolate reductase [NAD(P)H] [Ktedonobacterales bacterium]|jgi:methylenetetrahydrofolate reductase (NADPH)|nr:methylenetetrahydrofolate reductase [NAD(P)H] [Ktedonobacterales bacterium]
MHVTEVLSRATSPLISFEIIPPLRGGSVPQIMEVVEQLIQFSPPFIDVTGHSAEVSYEELPNGTLRRHVKRKRPGTLGLCAAIQSRFGIEAVPHLLCQGFTREETEDALIELQYLGIQNVMALQGDDHGYRPAERGDRTRNAFASDLVAQIVAMNQGSYLETLSDAMPTNFCIGVAGYPEKHFTAPNLARDLAYLKRKVDAGAHYIVTQMFFDNQAYFDFVQQCREIGITVPIIPGLKVLSSAKQLRTVPRTFFVNIPEAFEAEMEEATRPEQMAEIGVAWAVRQCKELLNAGVPCLHFYVTNNANLVTRVMRQITV